MGGLVQALNYLLQQVHKRRIRPTAIKCDRYRSAVVYIANLTTPSDDHDTCRPAHQSRGAAAVSRRGA
jgi:hypothetical protein